MAKRKKTKVKRTAQNFFARNDSKQARGHPNYVFEKVGNKYKSFGLTHHPKKEHPYIPLSCNPNPDDKTPSYIQKKILTTNSKYLKDRLPDWHFSKEDMSIPRHLRKAYKKRRK